MEDLKGELTRSIGQGTDEAIKVCKTIAPAKASELSVKTGWRVTRVSLKPRNPMIGTADAWEQKMLLKFETRLKKGEKAEALEADQEVKEPSGRYYRYMKALPVQAVCLNCHGPAEALDAKVRETLDREYPHDRATGYSEGQIRGAVSIKVPLDSRNDP